MTKVRPVPEGEHTLAAISTIQGAEHAIEFYKKAFGASEIVRMPGPESKVMHAALRVGDSTLMLSDEFPGMAPDRRSPKALGAATAGLYMYVEDVDAAFARAVAAGARAKMPPTDMFRGERCARLVDPFGHEWALASRTETLSPDEILKRQKALMAGAAQ